jgi:integrase
VAAFRDALERDPRLSRITVNKHLDSLRALFKAALSANVVASNPATGITASKAENTNYADSGGGKKTFTAEQTRAILKAAETEYPDVRWMLTLLCFVGARSGELAQLRVDDVTTLEGVPVLRIHDRHGPLKNRFSVRDIPIPSACSGIVDYAAKAKGPWLFSTFTAWNNHTRGATFQYFISKWLRETAGIADPKLTAHSLRHRWKAVAIEVDMPEPVRRAIMGHAEGTDAHASYGERVSLRKRAEWMARVDPLAR